MLTSALLVLGTAAAAQNEYAAIAELKAMNRSVQGLRSMADGEHYTTLEQGNVLRYAYASDEAGVKLLPAAAEQLTITDYALSPDERSVLLATERTPIYRHSYTTRYYLATGGRVEPILREAFAPRDASFSPDGSRIVYSDRNDLYVYDIASGATRRITDRRSLERGHQRHDRLGLRGGVRLRRAPTPSRPTARAWPTCASTRRRCP